MAKRAESAGIKHVHLVTWRDLDDPEAGGSEEHAAQISAHLVAAGLKVVHHTGAVPGAPHEIERNGVRVVRRGGRFGVFFATAIDSWRGKMGKRDGLIEVFHGLPLFAPLWSRGPRVAVIHHVHLGTWHHLITPPLDRLGDLIERYLVPLLYRRAQVATLAPSTQEEITRSYKIPASQITVARPGIEGHFVPGATKSETPLVVGVARLMPQKGVADLLKILASVRKSVPTLTAVVVGDGPQRGELEALRSRLGADDWLHFAGRVSAAELVRYYQQAWVVASASHREGFGLTLTEAAACGTPVVATRISGHTDAVSEGQSGLLAEDDQEFTDHLVALLSDDELRQEMGEGALAWASEFSWASCAASILDALCVDALAKKNTPMARIRANLVSRLKRS